MKRAPLFVPRRNDALVWLKKESKELFCFFSEDYELFHLLTPAKTHVGFTLASVS